MKKNIKFKVSDAVLKFVKKSGAGKTYVAAVVAAAGSSARMGNINKLFAEISGIPVLAITLSALNSSKYIDEIVLVSSENSMVEISKMCQQYGFGKVKTIVKGGSTRLESVYNGVQEVSSNAEVIAIHDGARPFVSDDVIKNAIDAACEYGAAAPAVPVKDTIKVVHDGVAVETPDRSKLYAVQTPQCFDAGLIKSALYNAISKKIDITDDCSAVEAIGGKIKLVDGAYDNIKITTPEDLALGEAIFNMEK